MRWLVTLDITFDVPDLERAKQERDEIVRRLENNHLQISNPTVLPLNIHDVSTRNGGDGETAAPAPLEADKQPTFTVAGDGWDETCPSKGEAEAVLVDFLMNEWSAEKIIVTASDGREHYARITVELIPEPQS